MPFAFEGFGVGLEEHVQAHSRTSHILKTYLHGVIYAPCLALSVGRELDRLRLLLKQIIDENNNPNSVILRIDNKIAGHQVLQLAIAGVNATLDTCDNQLRGAKIHPGLPEDWWAKFGTKMRFNGGEKGFLSLLHDLRYHCWALEVAYRVLRWVTILFSPLDARGYRFYVLTEELFRDDVDSLLGTMDPTERYLEDLLSFLTANFGGGLDYSISRKFVESAAANGGSFTSDYKLEAAMKSCMYWAFKANSDLRSADASKPATEEGYLNLLKSHWIFCRFRDDPRSGRMAKEFRAILAIVSTEIAFSMKRLLESKVKLPDWDSLSNFGDFRILLDDSDEEIQMSGTAVHPAQYNTYNSHPHPQHRGPGLVGATRPFRLPDGDSRDEKIPLYLKGSQFGEGNRPRGKSPAGPVTRKQLPGTRTNPNYEDSLQTSRTKRDQSPRNASVSSGYLEERRSVDSPTLGNYPPVSRSSGSPTSSSPIESMQFGVPQLQPQRGRGSQPRTSSLLRNGFPPKPLPPIDTQHLFTIVNDPRQPSHSDSIPRGGYQSPISPGSYEYADSLGNEPVEIGVRPGETEIMKDEFRGMSVLCSDFLSAGGNWSECMVRIFRNTSGDLRILTQRDGSVDQRFVVLKDAELIPEYGYHENFPVIYVRKAGIGGYSIQSGVKAKSPLPSAELCPITPYYRFKNVVGKQAVRTIRYRRSRLDGDHNNYKARIQLWKERDTNQFPNGDSASKVGSIAGTFRSRPPRSSVLKVHSTRLVMYLDEIIITLFVTDDITIEAKTRNRCLRIRPSSYKTFGNPSTVKACVIGNRDRDISGGIRLDMEGLLIDDQEGFDEFKWFEIDFQNMEEMHNFHEDFMESLQERRKERSRVADLQKKAANGQLANQ